MAAFHQVPALWSRAVGVDAVCITRRVQAAGIKNTESKTSPVGCRYALPPEITRFTKGLLAEVRTNAHLGEEISSRCAGALPRRNCHALDKQAPVFCRQRAKMRQEPLCKG